MRVRAGGGVGEINTYAFTAGSCFRAQAEAAAKRDMKPSLTP